MKEKRAEALLLTNLDPENLVTCYGVLRNNINHLS